MSVKFEDYYQTLNVSRKASADEIQQAYRKLARQFHPDVNKEKSAEERFKKISEAYEVLKDPEKRKKYDALGENWKAGQEFRPPPGWQGAGGRAAGRGVHVDVGDLGGFSEFFETIFGGGFGGGGFGGAETWPPGGGGAGRGGGRGNGSRRRAREMPGQDVEGAITISLAEAFHGATRTVSLQSPGDGEPVRTINVKIPAGTTEGSVIRLAGQGGESAMGGPSGDLMLRVHVAPDPRFEVHGHDLRTVVPITPTEAALGAKVVVPLIDSEATVTIPAGSQSGQKLRLKGKGLPHRGGGHPGDVLAELRIMIPRELTEEERELYRRLGEASNFNPRRA